MYCQMGQIVFMCTVQGTIGFDTYTERIRTYGQVQPSIDLCILMNNVQYCTSTWTCMRNRPYPCSIVNNRYCTLWYIMLLCILLDMYM